MGGKNIYPPTFYPYTSKRNYNLYFSGVQYKIRSGSGLALLSCGKELCPLGFNTGRLGHSLHPLRPFIVKLSSLGVYLTHNKLAWMMNGPRLPQMRGAGNEAVDFTASALLQRSQSIHHSPSTIHHSPFTIHHSPFTIHHSPFTIHHSPSTIHHPPFTIHVFWRFAFNGFFEGIKNII
jgi:hypothetical protein